MQSLTRRFNGNAKEVIEYARIWGRSKTAYHYKTSYDAMCRFLENKTGDPSFALFPSLTVTDGHNWAEDLLDAFIGRLHAMETHLETVTKERDHYRLQTEYLKGQQTSQVELKIGNVMALCRQI